MSEPQEPVQSLPNSQRAWRDLESLGYDIDALKRMNMNSRQVMELRDKAFRYRGLQVPEN